MPGGSVGERVRELRLAHALTQGQLAEKAGMSADGIVRIEVSGKQPRPSSIHKLARALGVSVEELTGRTAAANTENAERSGGAGHPSPEITQRFLSDIQHFVRVRAVEEDVPADALLVAAGEALGKLLLSGVPGREVSGVPREDAARLEGEERLSRIVVEP